MSIRRTAIVAAALTLACSDVPGNAGLFAPPECAPTLGQAVAQAVNDARSAHGEPPLAVDLRLVQAAERHSEDMAAADALAHDGTDGSTPVERATDAGYTSGSYLGEVVAAGYSTPAAAVEAWLASDGHRAILLAVAGDHLGVGHARSASGTAYWTALVGANESLEAPAQGCHPEI